VSVRLELPRWDGLPGDTGRALARVDAWATSAAMAELVGEFGGSAASRRPGELLDELDAFAAAHWDFRAGGERNLARMPQFPARREAVIQEATAALGLDSDAGPSRRSYDAVLMTGGMVRAAVVKPRYVRSLVDAGLTVRSIVFLGAFRRFRGDEAEVAARLGISGDGEFDAMVSGVDAAFGPLGEPSADGSTHDNPHLSWRELAWRHAGPSVSVLAAPSPDASRRANTADTLRFWAQRHAAGTRSVLLITTPVYVPYQNAVAVEILGLQHGLSVETVAVSAAASDLGADTQEFLSSHKLQELRSAIHGMRGLRAALIELL
jgi:hypothetical protein